MAFNGLPAEVITSCGSQRSEFINCIFVSHFSPLPQHSFAKIVPVGHRFPWKASHVAGCYKLSNNLLVAKPYVDYWLKKIGQLNTLIG
jgi:hypothetical protein